MVKRDDLRAGVARASHGVRRLLHAGRLLVVIAPGLGAESRSRSHSFAGSAGCRLHDDGVRVGLLSQKYGRGTVVLAMKELELTRRWDQLRVERPGTCPHL
jgi:hypothetical protein